MNDFMTDQSLRPDGSAEEKTVGILGGMGPEATIDFMTRVMKNTPATDDQDHIRMFVDHNPKVPSRIKALVTGDGESPAPVLRTMAGNLESMGADMLVMPCNTSHHYLTEIREAVTIPVLDMIQLTVREALSRHPGIRYVGLLASTAVLKTKLYALAFAEEDTVVTYPGEPLQEQLMEIITAVKRDEYDSDMHSALDRIIHNLADQGAEVLVIGCTEISAVLHETIVPVPAYDASEVLAREAVRLCTGQ